MQSRLHSLFLPGLIRIPTTGSRVPTPARFGEYRSPVIPNAIHRLCASHEQDVLARVLGGVKVSSLRFLQLPHFIGAAPGDSLPDQLRTRMETEEAGHSGQLARRVLEHVFIAHQQESRLAIAGREPTRCVLSP